MLKSTFSSKDSEIFAGKHAWHAFQQKNKECITGFSSVLDQNVEFDKIILTPNRSQYHINQNSSKSNTLTKTTSVHGLFKRSRPTRSLFQDYIGPTGSPWNPILSINFHDLTMFEPWI